MSYPDKLSLAGRHIIVSGAGGGGIGTATCDAVASAGADVLAIDIETEGLDQARKVVEAHGRRCVGVIADARTADAAADAVARGRAELGPPHGLVNVVGGALGPHWRSLLDYPEDMFDEMIDLNLRTAFLMSQAVARAMVDAGQGGSLVQLASISGMGASPFHFPYGAAKAAICQMTQTMAVEWGRHGIRCNAIAPGTIKTPRAGTTEDTARDALAIPLARRGEPADIAAVALFLLSDLSSYVTGQALAVDGGATGKLAFLGADNVPIFMDHPEIRAQLDIDSD